MQKKEKKISDLLSEVVEDGNVSVVSSVTLASF
jgi:hypothetical protein